MSKTMQKAPTAKPATAPIAVPVKTFKVRLILKDHEYKETKQNLMLREPGNLMGGLWIAKAKIVTYGSDAQGPYAVMREPQAVYYKDRYGLPMEEIKAS